LPKSGQNKIFLGWWLIISTGLITSIAHVLYQMGASVMFKPIAADLGLDRTATSMATSIGTLVVAVAFALTGWGAARYGPRWITFAGFCISGAGLLLMTQINSALTYYLAWGVIMCTGNSMAFSISIDTMITNWFVRKRGLAFSVRWGIGSLAGMAFLPVIAALVENTGWRNTCLIWGIFILVCAPFMLMLVKQHRPEYYGMLPDGAKANEEDSRDLLASGARYAAGVQEVEFTFKEALKTSSFWLITLGWMVMMAVYSGVQLHIVPFLTDRGIDPLAASSMMALSVFFTLPSRILGSLLADKVKKERLKYMLAGSLAMLGGGLAVFIIYPGIVSIYILLALYGLGFGAYAPLDTLIRGRYYGRKAYGSIQGVSMLFAAPVSFLAPVFSGWVFDTQGAYDTAFIVYAAMGIIGGILLCLIKLPRKK